mmetsp:Transcript_14877/g.29870  ORF Transcript_14877/g.29870 Transcript_14877/m.29870 type:complete len:1377 (+) Transcript_14877:110-4240(+)
MARGARGRSAQQLWALGIVLLSISTATGQEQMANLMGGHLSWAVDPEFMDGNRYVDFELTTTFVQKTGCSYTPGSSVTCTSMQAPTCTGTGATLNKCKVAEAFGVLCIAQLMEQVNNAGRRVLYVPKELNNPQFAQCVHELNIQVEGQGMVVTSDGASITPTTEEVGAVNAFTVMQVHDQNPADADMAEDRWRSNTRLVVGRLRHRVKVADGAAGLVAWLSPRVGFENLVRERGLLLPACLTTTGNSAEPCMSNLASFGREVTADTNSFEKDADGISAKAFKGLPFSSSDGYWHPSLADRFKQFWGANRAECGNNIFGCHEAGAPALETYVPLCALEGIAVQCDEREGEIFNYFSPAVPFPHVIEVAINTETSLVYEAPDANGGPRVEWQAPHPGFPVQSFDLDGHKMTQYSNALYHELRIERNLEGVKRGDHVLQTDPFLFAGRVDCIFDETQPPEPDRHWPLASSPTGCRELYDFDRDEANAKGNILKPDFSMSTYREKVFTQHFFNTLDFANGRVPSQSGVVIPNSHKTDSASVQNIFALYPCDPGVTNLPPEITTTQVNYECNFWEPCEITLNARDMAKPATPGAEPLQTTHQIVMQPALGMPFGTAGELVLFSDNNQECRGPGGALSCRYRLLDADVWNPQTLSFSVEAVGRMFVRCIVAYDVHAAAAAPNSRSCPSAPFCFKIQIAGSKPHFVHPTPLGLSFDDLQQQVPNRHNYVTCEGSTMELPLKVADSIPHEHHHKQTADKRLRIFAYDPDVEDDGAFVNPDFFADGNDIPQFDTCGAFTDYGASREGANAAQSEREAKVQPFAIVSDYLPNVSYTPLHETLLHVVHSPLLQRKNGVVLRLDNCAQQVGPGQRPNPDLAQCRVKQVNMDQTICAVGYDNSRFLTNRWVGTRDPDDGSGGDYASDVHCWLIRIAAPPVFVTDPDGEYTPFGDRRVEDTTDNPAAYKDVVFRVGERKTLTFLAQDPNSKDTVEVFILASPGIPRGMTVGASECVPITNGICTTRDILGSPPEFVSTDASACSRAKRTVEWTPGPETAGQNFLVCAVARDDSSLCAQEGGPPFATPEGWFGERQCVNVQVADVVVRWTGNLGNLLSPADPSWNVKAYVGCETVMAVGAASAELGGLAPGSVPYELTAMLDAERMTPAAVAAATVDSSQPAAGVTVHWLPARGMEGQEQRVCFKAEKAAALQVAGEAPMRTTCRGGVNHLVGCSSDADCTGGGVCGDMCVTLTVARCEYCVREEDTLVKVVRQYGFETNWLRLWALNSYQGSMGKEYMPGALFVGGDGDDGRASFRSPDLVVDRDAESRFLVGPIYAVDGHETALNVSHRFRTTVKALISMNPDVEWGGPGEAVPAGQELCILPCTTLPL